MSTSLFPVPSLSPYDGDVPGLPAFLDDLTAMRNYCMATDTFVSICMDAQRPAKDYFKDLFKAVNCAPVFSEGRLKVIPWSEISTVGNGTVYTAPTASGPVFDFDRRHFIVKDAGAPPLKVTRPKLFDVPNVVSVQYVNRDGEYNDATAMASDPALIAQYGPVRADPEKNDWVQDTDLAQRVAQLLLWGGDPTSATGGGTIARNRYSFTLPPHFGLFEPMDLVTVTDLTQGIYKRPVRLLSLKEQDDMTLEVDAEDFIYGAHAIPGAVISSAVISAPVGSNVAPGSVNSPVIFEALPALDAAAASGPRLWILASGPSPNYGGCHVWMSTDGGNSYQLQGTIVGNPEQGKLSAPLPAGADPDLADTLAVDLTESRGSLQSFTQTQEDLFQSLCYVAGGGYVLVGSQEAEVPYELVAYQASTFEGGYAYQMGGRLRRGVYGSPIATHPLGSDFVFLGGSELLKLSLAASYVGMRLYFKFTAFNTLGTTEQQLADAAAYPFTVTGLSTLPTTDEAATFGHPLTVEEVIERYEAEPWVSDGSKSDRPDLVTFADDAATYGHPLTVEEHVERYEADPWANTGAASDRADFAIADEAATFAPPVADEPIELYEADPWANDGSGSLPPPLTLVEDGTMQPSAAEEAVEVASEGGWVSDATGH